MNLPGFYATSGDKKDLYVNVTDFRLPVIQKSITFFMYYGFDTSSLERDAVKEYTIEYSSLNEFAQQLRCAIFNDFLYKSNCVKKDDDKVVNRGVARDEVETVFSLRFRDGIFEMQVDEHCAVFATVNLFELMGFKSEVYDAKNRRNDDKVLAPLGEEVDAMKICQRLTCGVPVQFLSEMERVCHLVIERCIEPGMYFNGGRYGVVCSYDLVDRKLTSNFKRFDISGLRNISFSVLNNDFKAYDFGCCLKSQSLRFVLNISKKI